MFYSIEGSSEGLVLVLQFEMIEKSSDLVVYLTRNLLQIWLNHIRKYNVQKKEYMIMLHLLFQESVRSISNWSDTLITQISIDLHDHSFIIQF